MNAPTTVYCITVRLTPESEGGYTVTCEELPELITDGHSVDEALNNVKDAFIATLELYEDLGRTLPDNIIHESKQEPALHPFQTMTPKLQGADDSPAPYVFQATLNREHYDISRNVA